MPIDLSKDPNAFVRFIAKELQLVYDRLPNGSVSDTITISSMALWRDEPNGNDLSEFCARYLSAKTRSPMPPDYVRPDLRIKAWLEETGMGVMGENIYNPTGDPQVQLRKPPMQVGQRVRFKFPNGEEGEGRVLDVFPPDRYRILSGGAVFEMDAAHITHVSLIPVRRPE